MYESIAYEDQMVQDYGDIGWYERRSDVQLPPIVAGLLLIIWAVFCLAGFGVVFLAKEPVVGIMIIAVPTFIAMILSPTFALCMVMLVLPTGAGIGFNQVFSLDRAIGLALAASFLLNALITWPRLRLDKKALWLMSAYTLWVGLALFGASYFGFELRRAFTQLQLLALAFIVYWIIESNGEGTFKWALRSYVIGTLGTITLAQITGAAIRSMEETAEGRYAATLGGAINANFLAALVGMAFLAAIYLLARDKNLLWRIVYVIALLIIPVMLLRIGSRGNIVALGISLLLPFFLFRQVMRRPGLALLLIVIILLAGVSASLIMKSAGLSEGVASRLTDVERAKEAISYRMQPIQKSVNVAFNKPLGTSYYGWFQHTGLRIWPHSDFFLILGVYGLPGALLFVLMVIAVIRTVMRTPMGLEKLYTRAVLTYLLVVGMNNAYVYKKFYWVFFAMILAGYKIAALRTGRIEPAAQSEAVLEEYSEDLHGVMPAY